MCRHKGSKLTEEHKEKIRQSNLGKHNLLETAQKISKSKTGKKLTEEHIKNLKKSIKSGEKHHSWKGGISRNKHSLSEPQYKEWRNKVFIRDNFKCKINNGDCNGQLQAHHILAWRDYVELRYDINNGITLCVAHHPRKWAEEKRLSPYFKGLVSVS